MRSNKPGKSSPAADTKLEKQLEHQLYKTILILLDTTPADRAILDHVKKLAQTLSSKVILLHVATSASAQVHGSDAVGEEIDEDRAYLDKIKKEFTEDGIIATAELAYGSPVEQIVQWVDTHHCDLTAMSTHRHQFIADLLLHGATASRVQHQLSVPVLLLRAN